MNRLSSCLIVIIIFFAPMAAPAAMVDLDITMDLKIASAFTWRGEIFNDEPVFQPSVTFATGNASLNIWGTWDITDTTNSSDHTRMDTVLDYTVATDSHFVRPGIVAYAYYDARGSDRKDTFEVFVDYMYNCIGSPTLSIFYDFAEIEGFYTKFSLRHSFPFMRKNNQARMALNAYVSVSAADEAYRDAVFARDASVSAGLDAYDPDGVSLLDCAAKIAMPFDMGRYGLIEPEIRYVALLDSDSNDALEARDEDVDQVIYSLTYSMAF